MNDINAQPLKDALRANLHDLLHGESAQAVVALNRIAEKITDGALFGAACGAFASVAADALRDIRANLRSRKARNAPFAFTIPEDAPAPLRAAVQLIVATVNDDKDMAFAIVRPWALEDADPEGVREMLFATAQFARAQHRAVCGGGHR